MFATMILGCTSCNTEQENVVQHHITLKLITAKYQLLY